MNIHKKHEQFMYRRQHHFTPQPVYTSAGRRVCN